jgi:ubiquinone/menaquinone biosynthesis C-methylase UbiE
VASRIPRRGLNNAITRFWGWAAPAYDAHFLQQWVYRPAQDEILAQLSTQRPGKVADIGCGTGVLADRIARELRPGTVYGVDMSVGMLNEARARSSKVEWLTGPAEQLPFEDGALDAVVTTSAFHFFDQPAALREFHRVLAPGGLAAVTTISPRNPIPLSRLIGSRWNPAHHPRPDEMRALFQDAGFAISEQHRVHRPVWTLIVSDMLTAAIKE